jgi:hypothetical protein
MLIIAFRLLHPSVYAVCFDCGAEKLVELCEIIIPEYGQYYKEGVRGGVRVPGTVRNRIIK